MAPQERDTQAIEAEHLLQVYKRVPLVLTRGEGSYIYDIDGQKYLDFVSGLGVASLGHAHPELAAPGAIDIAPYRTSGDRQQTGSLSAIGGRRYRS